MNKPTLEASIKKCLADEFAMPAINIQTIDHITILAEYAARNTTPIIAQFSARFIDFYNNQIGLKNLINLYADRSFLYFHLDHCDDTRIIKMCIEAGFDSVMFDGSYMNIKENISSTYKVVELARSVNVLVEGEVGAIAGVEDGFGKETGEYADIKEALEFYKETNVDLMAMAIGNAHGFYKSTSGLQVELFEKFQNSTNVHVPLVLHGGTGIPKELIHQSIESGVVKVNYSTVFKKLHQDTMRKVAEKELFNAITFFNELNEAFSEKLNEITSMLKR